jgi:hypothetical protein
VALYGIACALFVRQPRLSSFADDSVSYLVMAQVFSPYRAASSAVADAFAREAFYPPLFPLLLAAADAAHDLYAAHTVGAMLLALSAGATYLLGSRWLGSRWRGLLAAAVLAVLPAMWIHAKGILSEPLFMLLMLAVFLVMESRGRAPVRLAGLSLLMSALVLTRAVGLPMVGGYALWALHQRVRRGGSWRELLPPACAFASYGVWMLLRPAATADDYARVVAENVQGLAASQFAATAVARLMEQGSALADAWIGALMIYWVPGRPLPVFIAALVGAAALAGLALRLRQGRPDAVMIAAYLCVFLVWPFPGQMSRFLFPALPVLLLYSFIAAGALLRLVRQPERFAQGVMALLVLSLSLPALLFVRERARLGAESRYADMVEWYREPNLIEAHARAQVHVELLDDMDTIRASTAPGESVMWVTPAYIALLAGRRGIPAPPTRLPAPEYRQEVLRANPDLVFVSTFHPRNTVGNAAWKIGTQALAGTARVAHLRLRDGDPVSVLFRLRDPEQRAESAER